jgi:hypothetical protein
MWPLSPTNVTAVPISSSVVTPKRILEGALVDAVRVSVNEARHERLPRPVDPTQIGRRPSVSRERLDHAVPNYDCRVVCRPVPIEHAHVLDGESITLGRSGDHSGRWRPCQECCSDSDGQQPLSLPLRSCESPKTSPSPNTLLTTSPRSPFDQGEPALMPTWSACQSAPSFECCCQALADVKLTPRAETLRLMQKLRRA